MAEDVSLPPLRNEAGTGEERVDSENADGLYDDSQDSNMTNGHNKLRPTSQNNLIDIDTGESGAIEHIYSADSYTKQESEITRSVSISGILRDVEIESIDRNTHTPDDDNDGNSGILENRNEVTVDIYTPRMSNLGEETELNHNVKLPSITARSTKPRRSKKDKPQYPKYTFNHTKRYYIYNTRVRLSKVFTKQQKFVMMKSEANFIRMCKIVLFIGTAIMKDVLKAFTEKMYPPKTFQQFLEHFKRRLISYASTEKLINDRWKNLFPDEASTGVYLNDLEPALTFWFLRHICHFKKQTDLVWKWKPATDDLSAMADITRIRDLRNSLINAVDYAIFEEEYDRKINEMSEILSRACTERRASELQQSLKDMTTGGVRLEERDQYLAALNKWASDTKDRYIEKISPAKQDWNTVKLCKGVSTRFLKRFRKPKVFVKTTSYEQAKEILHTHGYVVLKGNTGEGKTTAAVAMMASLYEEDDVLIMSSAEHWKYVNKHSVGAILLDDLFGSMHFDEKQLKEWLPHLPALHRCSSSFKEKQSMVKRCDGCSEKTDRPAAKLIITIRKHVYDQQKKVLSELKLFDEQCIVDFSSKELNYTEKRMMLSRHVVAGHKVKSEVEKSSKTHTSTLGFPETCSLFVSKDEFMDMGSAFFESPVAILRMHLDKLFQSDMYGYLILVVMMFQPGAVIYHNKLQEFKDEEFRTQLFDLAIVVGVTVNKQLPGRCLLSLATKLHPYVYYYEDIGCYTFSHESVMEIMMSTFVERHPQHVLENCDLQFTMDYVATDIRIEESGDQIFVMRIQKHNFWVLSELFSHYITYGYVVKVAQHRAFRDLKFLNFFFDFVKKKGMIADLILKKDNTAMDEESTDKRHVGLLYGSVDMDKPNADLAIAILKLGCHVQKVQSPQWCMSELRSSLCVAVRRGSYDIYIALITTEIDIPDKLMVEQRYLTSLKIISDMILRRQWSQEQIDVGLVRAARRGSYQSSEIVLHLINHGASVGSIRAETTALCEAVKSGSIKTVNVLLDAGASFYDMDSNEQTPLHHACDWNQIEIAKLLVSNGADINARDSTGLSPFLVAAGWERLELLDLFLARKVNAFTVDEQDNNVLHICAANGRTMSMKKILNVISDEMETCLTARNKYGWTPLDFAIRCGHLGVAKVLVRTILRQELKIVRYIRTFNHMRFNVMKKDDFNKNEKFSSRFVDLTHDGEYFQVPKCKWFVHAGNKHDYDRVSIFVAKYDDRLKKRYAKT